MSPLWRDQIRVFFAPGRVELVRSYRGIKPVQAAKLTAACEREQDAPAWEQPLRQLDRMIADAAGLDMIITLSNDFVRYAVVSPQVQIVTPAELYAYAAFHMREVYGERAAAWTLAMSSWDPCNGGICAAIESTLLQQLNELAMQHKVRLKSIAPYLASSFDQWCKRFKGERIWFALVETGRLCLASLSNGVWQGIRNQRMLHNAEDELLAALDQEAILFSARKEAVEQVYLFAPEHPELALPSDCGWRIIPLQTGNMPAPPLYPVAVAAPDRKN
ncbi:hypothetical protein [Nitrosospira sp. NpAV]|uniref:hypothetical protein n=1 Tax=Nitrosospira sp. NpAV TaxID=58133 RepID=UPI00059FBBCC|nr:hypothetical protein [Nitrosospira sp. NpAV]KIO50482.1 hypothetical protein SQ11_02175 [Nitrosospira sp. NpAV]